MNQEQPHSKQAMMVVCIHYIMLPAKARPCKSLLFTN